MKLLARVLQPPPGSARTSEEPYVRGMEAEYRELKLE